MTIAEEEIKKVSEVHPFLEYVEEIIGQNPQLYSYPSLALLTYRYSSPLSQFVINRLLMYKGPVPFIEVRNWFRPEFKAVQNKVLWRLKQLQILQGRGQEVWINPTFQQSLLLKPASLKQNESKADSINVTDSDTFARARWEGVLYELVKDSSTDNSAANKRVKRDKSDLENLLSQAGLVNNGKVTNVGFQFLLKDISSQIWSMLLFYLKLCGNDLKLLEFIANQILYGKTGQVIQAPQLSSSHLRQLEEFGLIMTASGSKNCDSFTATRLLTSLSGLKNELDFTDIKQASNNGFLIIETNYRVYAYTSSPLQIATLALFVNLQDRFPNMVYGQLTGESVQSALSHGITADQIIQYLQLNVHSSMLRTAINGASIPFNGIPFTVVDQIRLWELDRKRLALKSGYLYQQFLSEPDYTSALEEAKTIGAVLYAKPNARILIVAEEGHEHMKQFCKKRT